jgi:restriction system protein
MAQFWMVRAGRGGQLADEFRTRGLVAIGWSDVGDLSQFSSVDDMRTMVAQKYPGHPGKVINNAGVLHKFAHRIS